MDKGASEAFQAQVHLHRHSFKIIESLSLKCAIQLGIPDVIHNHGQPITLSQLVSALGIHDPSKATYLHRLMRMLIHSGFFQSRKVHDQEEEAYVLTSFSQAILLKDSAPCMSSFVLGALDPVLVAPFHFVADWMHGNKLTAFESAHGMTFWEYNEQNTEYKALFQEAMACDSKLMWGLVEKDCKPLFESLGSLVDVGGGTGTIARMISEAYPNLKCTVLDLPHVVAGLPESENLSFVKGDMFQFVPSADAILLRHVYMSGVLRIA